MESREKALVRICKLVFTGARTGSGGRLRRAGWPLPREEAAQAGGGLIDAVIDPINCAEIDPLIRALSGRRDQKPQGWSTTAFNNKNNHSIVIRVDFGQTSFLFTGDLEEEGISELIGFYGSNPGGILDIDVYQVGHHGSHNGTTPELVAAMTPQAAVISMGRWNFGMDSNNPFTTYNYGHPRWEVIDLLSDAISGYSGMELSVLVGLRSRQFAPRTLWKRVYATGWTGTVVLRADSAANMEFVIESR